ncbi:MAG: hypothetical protein JWN01_50 [Patescibacteria group bacterium]|nr:hypothetical protein [Patescibacteria group bacterium]
MAEETEKKSWVKRHKVWTGILIFIGLAMISNALGGGDKKTSTAQTASTQQSASASPKPTPTPTPKAEQPKIPAEYKSALSKAASYATTMHMSKQGVYDQLTSDYGEKFSAAAAQYAIDNMKADWNANALNKAKSYQSTMNMSPAAIHDQLTSASGEKFAAAEADYAIAHLND